MKSTSKIYTKVYSDMGGVDFSGEPSAISSRSFAYLENMYRDYGSGMGAGIETVPGYRTVAELGARVHAIHPHPSDTASLLVHAGKHLYRLRTEERDSGIAPPRLLAPGGTPAVLADRKSRAAIANGQLYLLDGERYLTVSEDRVTPVDAAAYLPTVYSDGAPLEQPNLLTDRAYEEYHLHATEHYAYASEGFTFTLTVEGLCFVSGYTGNEETVTLPKRAALGARDYTVSGISTDAFRGNTAIKTLILPEGISLLEPRALFGMHALETLVLPTTVTRLSIQCLDDCEQLKTLYLPRTLRELGANLCDASTLLSVHFGGTSSEFVSIEGYKQLVPSPAPSGFHIFYESVYRAARYRFPLHLPTAAVLAVTLDSAAIASDSGDPRYRCISAEEGRIAAICLETSDHRTIDGKTLSLSLSLSSELVGASLGCGHSFTGSGRDAVNGCTLIARFEDRLFLTGNPALPGVVLYTHRRADGESDPAYIGLYNSFTDGDGRAEVRAILPTADSLLVMTEELPELPSLFCHTGQDTEDDTVPRIYPLAEEIGGLGGAWEATVFLGEALFLSRHGLEAVERTALYEERRTGHRSSAVDARLLREELGEASLFRFGTYLGIAVGGRVYLADGRRRSTESGHSEYEWYYLSGIGSFPGDAPRYRLQVAPLPDALADIRVTVEGRSVPIETAEEAEYADGLPLYSLTAEGITLTYAVRNGRALLAATDGERCGGSFSPATAFRECEDLLFFGTEAGSLLVFNTDRRNRDGIIPRRYYSFCGHAYPSGCATKIDNCDLPNYRKSTVRSGGAVRLKAMTGGKLEVRVRTEEGSFSVADTLYGGRGSFEETDFASAEFHLGEDVIVPLREAKRRWVEKQLYFVSEEYQRPFGILSVAYQYRVAGRI